MNGLCRRLAVVAALVLLVVPATAQDGPAAEASPVRGQLDAIREDLVQLRFEKALAALDALLGDATMAEADRVEALVLRTQAHAALGDFDATEDGYREILRSRPGYVPEASLIPDKAMQRFRKVRSQMVGVARITLSPPEARLTVDGRVAIPGSDGALALLAGTRVLRAEARGHDPEETVLEIAAGAEFPVQLQLLPNSRDVVLRTRPGGVSVLLDGVLVGETRQVEGDVELGRDAPAAELRLPNVALGQHVFRLEKPCYRTERRQDMLTVDLLDRSAKTYETVVMRPSRAAVTIAGGPGGAELYAGGERRGKLPLAAPLELCPGTVELDVRVAGRSVWRATRTLTDDERAVVEVQPRPNAAIVGVTGWPAGLAEFGAGFSTTAGVEAPRGADLSRADDWSRVTLPPHTDLALAVLPPEREGGRDRWVLYSPRLLAVEPLPMAPATTARPGWSRPVWGMMVADSRIAGGAVVVEVLEGGPAARAALQPGERVLAVAGREVAALSAIRDALGSLRGDGPVTLRVQAGAGAPREVALTPAASPALWAPGERQHSPVVFAAWAEVDAVAFPDRAPAALANLALLLAEQGRHALAVETWRRVRWGQRPGIGEGTTAYHLGRALLALGREEEAVQAFRRAAASAATTGHDDGPAVAPAARDHLADLGVVGERR